VIDLIRLLKAPFVVARWCYRTVGRLSPFSDSTQLFIGELDLCGIMTVGSRREMASKMLIMNKRIVRTIGDLNDDERAIIVRLYVDEKKIIKKVSEEVKIRYDVVSGYLRSQNLTRSLSHYAKSSHWRGLANASRAEHDANVSGTKWD